MGWGRMMLFGDVGQQLDISDLQSHIAAMQREFLRNQRLDLDQAKSMTALQRENQELKLYLVTLVRLLVAKGVLKPEEIETTVRAVETSKETKGKRLCLPSLE